MERAQERVTSERRFGIFRDETSLVADNTVFPAALLIAPDTFCDARP